MSHDGPHRPSDPAGTRPKVDPEALRAAEPAPDLPWAERDTEAGSRLDDAIERLEEVHVEEEPGASQHVGRFQFILGGLIAIAAIAIAAIVVVLVAGRNGEPDTSWSAWHPTGNDPLQQIATHVGSAYRLEDGTQIAAVTGGPLEVGMTSKVPARVLAGSQVLDGQTALFTLCGSGANCSIPGTPTDDRGLLVRREALELALYALHYTDADQVVVMVPPPAVLPTFDRAVLVRRSDVKNLLEQPLSASLPEPTPRPSSVGTSPGKSLVDHLTSMYGYQLAEAGDLSVYLQLGSLRDAEAAAKQALASALGGSTTATTSTPQMGTTTTPQVPRQAKGTSGGKGG